MSGNPIQCVRENSAGMEGIKRRGETGPDRPKTCRKRTRHPPNPPEFAHSLRNARKTDRDLEAGAIDLERRFFLLHEKRGLI